MEVTEIMAIAIIVGLLLLAFKKKVGTTSEEPPEPRVNLPSTAPPNIAGWQSTAMQAAALYGLPWQIVLAQIWQESSGIPTKVGGAGEIGLMQLKPIAIQDLKEKGYGDFTGWAINPQVNVRAGAAYLHLQRQRSNGVLADALGSVRADALESYNEGFAAAKRDLGPDEYTNKILEKAKVLGYNA